MKRGYIRIRQSGPDETIQRLALAMAGVNANDVLVAPSDEIRAILSPGDELVVYDAATLGTSVEDILSALVVIDQQDATLYVIETGMTYRWHPEAVNIAALARIGSETAQREKTSEARKKRLNRKLTPQVVARALELWRDPAITSAKEVTAVLRSEGITVSVRTLYNVLKIGRATAKQATKAITLSLIGDAP